MELEFFGAAGEVTGSCHIVRAAGKQLLLDCGMIQGGRDAPARNRRDFPFKPQSIDAVVLSHAHLDHCGRLPLLVQRGFRGPIYTNRACRDLLPVLLKDSAKLAERDAERRNRHRDEDDDDVEPLYTLEDVEQTLELVRAFTYDEPHRLFAGITVRVRDAGHILGSSSVELWVTEAAVTRKLLFSGDLGQYDSPILLDPHAFQQADVVLMESTYGNRLHRDRDATEQELGEVLAAAWRDRGNVIIPAFAIGRSQELLYLFAKHFEDWNMGRWKIFLDSPMAIEASEIYWQHDDRYDTEALHLRSGFGSMPPLPNLVLSRSADESKSINTMRRGAIIIAGSGMCTGGRILHHLKRQAGCKECHIVFTGFQAPGTLGRMIVDRSEKIRIHGQQIEFAAQVHTLGGLSAHGDQHDLLRWYGSLSKRPPVYLVHGESEAAEALAVELRKTGATVTVAEPGLKVALAALPALADDAMETNNQHGVRQ
ncbi:MAG TPA: MBL fold metallo-hydrolase [Steroidobacteraceae bacterium]|nr:MBL fold metallo-hydrolase [Steroidobacteraceae bacterium]HRX91017.1 MBL fold metallo-hydrolase [Steroidobacteraceae bacterium]